MLLVAMFTVATLHAGRVEEAAERVVPADAVVGDRGHGTAHVAHEDMAAREMRGVLGLERIGHVVALVRGGRRVEDDAGIGRRIEGGAVPRERSQLPCPPPGMISLKSTLAGSSSGAKPCQSGKASTGVAGSGFGGVAVCSDMAPRPRPGRDTRRASANRLGGTALRTTVLTARSAGLHAATTRTVHQSSNKKAGKNVGSHLYTK